MKPYIDPKVDYVFKWLFGKESHKALLISLLNAVLKLPKGHTITSVHLLNPFNDKESFDDKLTILDIKARDQQGRQYNIEMQLLVTPILPARLVYYWAVLHADQLREGEDYTKLQPTITICFVNSVLIPDEPDYHWHFQLGSKKHPNILLSGHLSIHLIELPKFQRRAEELLDPLDAWCYFLKHGETMDTTNLPETLQHSPVEKAMEELTVFAQNDVERERYQSRLKAQRDYAAHLQFTVEEAVQAAVQLAEQRGREEGRTEGRTEGRDEGIVIGGHVARIRMYQAMLHQSPTPEETLTEMPLAELAALERSLEQQLPKP